MTDAVDKLWEILADETSRVWSLKGVSKAILTAIQSDPLAYVKVKPLDWGEKQLHNASHREPEGVTVFAETAFGIYRLDTFVNDHCVTCKVEFNCTPVGIGKANTYAAAQAAATADYHNRLKECFE